jgi:hypothetical protein
MYNEGILTFQAGEDLVAHRRVRLEAASSTTPPEIVYADAGEQHIGVTTRNVSDGDMVSVKLRNFPGSEEVCAAGTFAYLATLYGAADGKVDDTSSGSAIGVAKEAATAAGDLVEILPFNVLSTTAGTVSIADAGTFTSTATVEAATQEIYQHIASAQAIINLPMGGWTEEDGTALADFANAASPTPGWSAGDEGFGIRWNNHGTPDPISTSTPIPPDLDASADVVIHVLAAKTGNTGGDAVTWLFEAFNNADGAAYDADTDFGGTSSAMTAAATAKTCQEETLTLASANVAASPCVLSLTMQPTDGTLGTDDVIVLGVWLEYTRKILTA